MRFKGMITICILGAVILAALGIWQTQRLHWKNALLADMAAKISAPPVELPASIDTLLHSLLPVHVQGTYTGPYVRVLVSQKLYGAGYRIIAPLRSDAGRLVMVDRGFVSINDQVAAMPQGRVTVTGNLYWPDEIDGFTPDDDLAKNIWFARGVEKLATHFQAEPVLIIANGENPQDQNITPLAQNGAGIPNNHLEYAVTWFSLMLIWLAMGGYFIFKIRKAQKQKA